MNDTYKIIEEYNPNKKQKLLILFYDMITDMLSNKKNHPIFIDLFIGRKKLNISLVFSAVPKNIRLNSTHYFVRKIPNEKELQQITFNYSSDIDFQDLNNLYKKCTASFWLSILLLHQIILHVLDRIF